MIGKGTAQTSLGIEKCSLGEETVRIAENSTGTVVIRLAKEQFGKTMNCVGKTQRRKETLRKSLDWSGGGKVQNSTELFRKGEGIALNGGEWLGNSTVAIGFAEEPD